MIKYYHGTQSGYNQIIQPTYGQVTQPTYSQAFPSIHPGSGLVMSQQGAGPGNGFQVGQSLNGSLMGKSLNGSYMLSQIPHSQTQTQGMPHTQTQVPTQQTQQALVPQGVQQIQGVPQHPQGVLHGQLPVQPSQQGLGLAMNVLPTILTTSGYHQTVGQL